MIIVITGANRGLGKALTEKFLQENNQVIMVCRNKESSSEVFNMFNNKYGNVYLYQADLGSIAEIEQLGIELKKNFSKIDALLNCGAVNLDGMESSIATMDISMFRNTMQINLVGSMWMCKTLLPLLLKSDDARIVNFSSGLGQLSVPRMGPFPAYSISKTAVNALTKILAEELINTNVTVVSVDPGWVKTDMGGPNAMLEIEEGIDTPYWLVTAPKHNISTGTFYKERKVLGW
ncbi:MAG: SDR family NAD(P)-dependent oxidoreductase [Bacteroidales bacterium]